MARLAGLLRLVIVVAAISGGYLAYSAPSAPRSESQPGSAGPAMPAAPTPSASGKSVEAQIGAPTDPAVAQLAERRSLVLRASTEATEAESVRGVQAGAPPSPGPVGAAGTLATATPARQKPAATPRKVRKAVVVPRPTVHALPPATTGRITGSASWYCRWPTSACTRGWSEDGAYAAAGPLLRRALGNWRGRVVLVNGISTRLIDWCACPNGRVIDLYSSVFSRIAPLSAGVVRVEVRW